LGSRKWYLTLFNAEKNVISFLEENEPSIQKRPIVLYNNDDIISDIHMSHPYHVIVRFTKWTTFASISRNGTAVSPLHVHSITQYGQYLNT